MSIRVQLTVETCDGELEVECTDPLATYGDLEYGVALKLIDRARNQVLAALREKHGIEEP